MIKSPRALVNEGIITNVERDENIQQVGVDLNLIKVEKIYCDLMSLSLIPNEGKSVLTKRAPLALEELTNGKPGWFLQPGVYDITFSQGCKIPNNLALFIRQRSSLLRNGVLLHSSVFDPGFETDQMGTILFVHESIQIECGARVAQIYAHYCESVEERDLYGSESKGSQYQKDIQREKQEDIIIEFPKD